MEMGWRPLKKTPPFFRKLWSIEEAQLAGSCEPERVICSRTREAGPAVTCIAVADGSEVWRYPLAGVAGMDARVVAARVDREVHILDTASGALMDVMDFAKPRSVALTSDAVVAVQWGGVVSARNRSAGQKLWTRRFERFQNISATATLDGALFLTTGGQTLRLDPSNGDTIWHREIGAWRVEAVGNLILATTATDIHALDANGGSSLWSAYSGRASCVGSDVHTTESVRNPTTRAWNYVVRDLKDGTVKKTLPISGAIPKEFLRHASDTSVQGVWGRWGMVGSLNVSGAFFIDSETGEASPHLPSRFGDHTAIDLGRRYVFSGSNAPLICLELVE